MATWRRFGRDPQREKTRDWRRWGKQRRAGYSQGCTCGYCMAGLERYHEAKVSGVDRRERGEVR